MGLIDFLRLETISVTDGFMSSTLFLLVLLAVLIVTGLALYKAARLEDKMWFWIMMVVGTFGIVPVIYLYVKRKQKPFFIWSGKK